MVTFLNNPDGPSTFTGTPADESLGGSTTGYTFLGNSDNDALSTGAGNDVITITPGQDTLDGGPGYDTLQTNVALIFAGADFSSGQFQSSNILGLTVDLAAGTYGGNWFGISFFNGNFSTGPVFATQSSGTLTGIERVVGTRGNDSLSGSDLELAPENLRPRGESFLMTGGADVIDGRGGFDLLEVGNADVNSPLFGRALTIDAQAGTWTPAGGPTSTFANIEGFELSVETDDTFIGSDRDEFIVVEGGSNTIDGGGGFDIIDYGSTALAFNGQVVQPVNIDMTQGIFRNGNTGMLDTVRNVEGFHGTDQRDRMIGDDGDQSFHGDGEFDFLKGGGGNDTLLGGAGGDGLIGDSGNDIFVGGLGRDSMEGGTGTDTVDYSLEEGTGGLTVDMTTGQIRDTFGFTDILTGIEVIVGSTQGDRMTGGDGTDVFLGDAGDDILIGGTSTNDLRDQLFGGDGDDTIDGGYGNDELRGDAGNDQIAGGFGADTVIGGAGNDTLTGSAFGDLMFGGDGMDFVNGGFGSDRVNGGAGADRFFHLGIADHGNDWIQDYGSDDVLVYGGAASATADQFQVNRANTANAGDASVDEAFVIYKPTGQILWALVDGFDGDGITLRLASGDVDLLA